MQNRLMVTSDFKYAIEDVQYAFKLIEFSIRNWMYFELKKVDINLFGQDCCVLLCEGNITFSDNYFSDYENAITVAKMNIGSAFGTSAIALDNLFEARGLTRQPNSNDEVHRLWSLVYAVRNAFAHGSANPRWVVRKRQSQRLTIEIEHSEFIIDLSALNGSDFEYQHIGGFANWEKIKTRSLELLTGS